MSRVELTFSGNSRGAVGAATATAAAIERVKLQAGQSSVALGHHSKALKEGETEMGRFTRGTLAGSGAMSHFGRSLAFASGGFLAAAGLISVMRESVKGASSLETQIARTTREFGTQATGILAWSKTSAEALHQTRVAALATANDFGTLFANLGFAPGKTAEMSKTLTQLAADISAVTGKDSSTTTAALTSALAGRTLGLKQLGVAIDANMVKTEAERLGLVKSTVDLGKVAIANEAVRIAEYNVGVAVQKHGAQSVEAAKANDALAKAQDSAKKAAAGHAETLTLEQKALATYNLVLAQTQKMHNGVANSSHTLAGETALLHAQIGNLQEELGTALIPQLTKYLPLISEWITKNEKNGTFQRDFNQAVKLGGEVVSGVVGTIRAAVKVWGLLADAAGGNKHALELLAAFMVSSKLLGGFSALTTAAGEQGAAGAIGLLRGRLLALAKMGTIAIAIELIINRQSVQDYLSKKLGSTVGGTLGASLFMYDTLWKEITAAAGGGNSKVAQQAGTQTQTRVSATGPGSGIASAQGGGFIPQGQSYVEKRSDQGRDLQTNPGGNIIAPGDGAVIAILHNPGSGGGFFGNDYPVVEFTTGPYRGQGPIYLGHVIADRSVGGFKKGDILGHTASNAEANANVNGGAPPGWAEIGFAPGGTPGMVGQRTPFGAGSGAAGAVAATVAAASAGSGSTAGFIEKAKAAKVRILTGSALLDKGLQLALATAHGTKGTTDDLKYLKDARAELEKLQATASKAEQVPIAKELANVNRQITAIDTANLKSKLREIAAAHKQAVADAKAAFAAEKTAWQQHVRDLNAAATAAKQVFEQSWQEAVNATLSAFDTVTTTALSKMQKDTAAAITALKVTVQGSGFGSFLFGTGAQTPTEILLAQRAAAKQKADDITSIADATKQLADAQAALAAGAGGTAGTPGTAGHGAITDAFGNTVTGIGSGGTAGTPADLAALQAAVVAAQKALDDAKYQQESDDLAVQAQLERDAADKALADAQQAVQDKADLAQQAYQDQRVTERQNITDWLAFEQAGLEAGTIQWTTFYAQLVALAGAQGFAVGAAFWGAYQDAGNASGNVQTSSATAKLIASYKPVTAGSWQGLVDPNGVPVAAGFQGFDSKGNWTGVGGFASGGWSDWPRPRVDPRDTIPAMLRKGEYVETPEDIAAGGPAWQRNRGGSGIGDVYLDGAKVGKHIAQHVTNAQERQSGYPSARS